MRQLTEDKLRTNQSVLPITDTRSEEVDEIVGDIPGWLSRWGISSIFLFFVLMLILSWFIKYPDIVKSKIIITTTPTPLTLVSRTSGRIHLVKSENGHVYPGEMIAYLQSNAIPADVLAMERQITDETSDVKLSTGWDLGELQTHFTNYRIAQEDQRVFINSDRFGTEIRHLEKQRNHYSQLSKNLRAQFQLQSNELVLASAQYKRDSALFRNEVTSREDFEASQVRFLQIKREHKNFESQITLNEIQSTNVISQMAKLTAEESDVRNHHAVTVQNSRKELLAAITKWKENYLFTSTIQGTTAFLRFLENDMFIEQGSALFSIVPIYKTIYAQMEIPITGSGKVKEGMSVNIRLANFPYAEFGMLRGRISRISKVPTSEGYNARVTLDNGLITTYNKTLDFIEQLQGEAEIITDDRRVLERIFFNLKSLVDH